MTSAGLIRCRFSDKPQRLDQTCLGRVNVTRNRSKTAAGPGGRLTLQHHDALFDTAVLEPLVLFLSAGRGCCDLSAIS